MPRSDPDARILVLATRNRRKTAEIRELLGSTDWAVRSCEDFPGCPVLEETGRTFEANAMIKARAVAAYTGHIALGDDSGLEVDALNGAPGVYSARFSGPDATDASNNALLLRRLDGVPGMRRTARFRCVIAIAMPDGAIRTVEGVCTGRIAFEPRGAGGFGYDPLFIPDGYTRTFGEMDAGLKNRISHRGQAVRAARAYLQTLLINFNFDHQKGQPL